MSKELEKYKITIDFLKFEASTLWQIFTAFFIGHNILAVIIIELLTNEKAQPLNYPLLFFIGIAGLIIAFLWLATFKRNSDWYNFRMEQAKRAEADYVKMIEDDDWYLLNREAEKFADGYKIKGLRNSISANAMIIVFITIYIALIIYSLSNLICGC